MPARRRYIAINGVEYTGVSRHRQSGRCFILRNGNRQYFRSAEQARAAYMAAQLGDISDLERVKLEAAATVRGFLRIEKALEQIDEHRARCAANGLPVACSRIWVCRPCVQKHPANQKGLFDRLVLAAVSAKPLTFKQLTTGAT